MSDEVIDLSVLIELKEIMEDDFSELIETFIMDGQEQLNNLRLAIDESNSVDVRRIAHTLKGSCANLGATALSEACMTLEHNAADDNLSGADEQYDQINKEYLRLKTALNENF